MTLFFTPTASNSAYTRVAVCIGLICSAAIWHVMPATAAPIYKVVDEQTGQVTFTDRPQSYEQQANKQISQTSVMTGDSSRDSDNQETRAQAQNTPDSEPETTKAATINYQLTMVEPSESRAYRRPAQSIVVGLQVQPDLQSGDWVSILLDGNEVGQGLNASLSTVDILPGSHVIEAAVMDKKGQQLAQVSRTVYVIQNTQTFQNNKKKAEQLLAYQRLPWYQKVWLKMRQDGKQPNAPTLNKPTADTPMTLEQPVIK